MLLARGVRLGLPLERGDLLAERGQRRQPPRAPPRAAGAAAAASAACALQPLHALGGGDDLMVGDAELGLERQRGLAEPLELLPPGPDLGQPSLGRPAAAALPRASPALRGRHPLAGARLGRLDLGQIAQPAAERFVPRPERGAPLLEPVLRRADPLVPEHAGEELRPLRRATSPP